MCRQLVFNTKQIVRENCYWTEKRTRETHLDFSSCLKCFFLCWQFFLYQLTSPWKTFIKKAHKKRSRTTTLRGKSGFPTIHRFKQMSIYVVKRFLKKSWFFWYKNNGTEMSKKKLRLCGNLMNNFSNEPIHFLNVPIHNVIWYILSGVLLGSSPVSRRTTISLRWFLTSGTWFDKADGLAPAVLNYRLTVTDV